MTIEGEILEIGERIQVTESFTKRLFVVNFIEDNPDFATPLQFETIQDKCDELDKYQVGNKVKVHYNLRGRRWEAPDGTVKHFNTIQAWKIEALEPQQNRAEAVQDIVTEMESKVDKLPF